MPEQAALSELVLSWTYKRCQRVLSEWLEHQPGAHMSVMGARKSLQSLTRTEWVRLMAWLENLLYAAHSNHDMVMAARIERLATSLGRTTPAADSDNRLPAAAISLTRQPLPRSA